MLPLLLYAATPVFIPTSIHLPPLIRSTRPALDCLSLYGPHDACVACTHPSQPSFPSLPCPDMWPLDRDLLDIMLRLQALSLAAGQRKAATPTSPPTLPLIFSQPGSTSASPPARAGSSSAHGGSSSKSSPWLSEPGSSAHAGNSSRSSPWLPEPGSSAHAGNGSRSSPRLPEPGSSAHAGNSSSSGKSSPRLPDAGSGSSPPHTAAVARSWGAGRILLSPPSTSHAAASPPRSTSPQASPAAHRQGSTAGLLHGGEEQTWARSGSPAFSAHHHSSVAMLADALAQWEAPPAAAPAPPPEELGDIVFRIRTIHEDIEELRSALAARLCSLSMQQQDSDVASSSSSGTATGKAAAATASSAVPAGHPTHLGSSHAAVHAVATVHLTDAAVSFTSSPGHIPACLPLHPPIHAILGEESGEVAMTPTGASPGAPGEATKTPTGASPGALAWLDPGALPPPAAHPNAAPGTFHASNVWQDLDQDLDLGWAAGAVTEGRSASAEPQQDGVGERSVGGGAGGVVSVSALAHALEAVMLSLGDLVQLMLVTGGSEEGGRGWAGALELQRHGVSSKLGMESSSHSGGGGGDAVLQVLLKAKVNADMAELGQELGWEEEGAQGPLSPFWSPPRPQPLPGLSSYVTAGGRASPGRPATAASSAAAQSRLAVHLLHSVGHVLSQLRTVQAAGPGQQRSAHMDGGTTQMHGAGSKRRPRHHEWFARPRPRPRLNVPSALMPESLRPLISSVELYARSGARSPCMPEAVWTPNPLYALESKLEVPPHHRRTPSPPPPLHTSRGPTPPTSVTAATATGSHAGSSSSGRGRGTPLAAAAAAAGAGDDDDDDDSPAGSPTATTAPATGPQPSAMPTQAGTRWSAELAAGFRSRSRPRSRLTGSPAKARGGGSTGRGQRLPPHLTITSSLRSPHVVLASGHGSASSQPRTNISPSSTPRALHEQAVAAQVARGLSVAGMGSSAAMGPGRSATAPKVLRSVSPPAAAMYMSGAGVAANATAMHMSSAGEVAAATARGAFPTSRSTMSSPPHEVFAGPPRLLRTGMPTAALGMGSRGPPRAQPPSSEVRPRGGVCGGEG